MTRWPLPLITTTVRLTGNEAKCLLVNLCVGHVLWFWEWSRDGDYLCVWGVGGGFTVTYSCFLPRAKLRTAGSVTRLQIVLFLFQTLEIFKHVGNNISLKEFCICQNYARSVGKSSRHHRRAKTTWILFCVAVYHSHRPHALTALSRWIEESVCECELPKISVFTQPFLDKLLPPKQTLKNNHLSRVKLTLLAPLKPT